MSLPDIQFQPPVIAHRGARTEAPENTLAAFRRAVKSGARWIETDVKLTHDGVPILIHDDTLNRTTNGKGAVADMLWTDMQRLDAGSWFNPTYAGEHIPTLTEALNFVLNAGMRINLELKPCPGRTQATAMVSLIEAAKVWPQDAPPPLISSFDIEALKLAAQLHPDWPRGLLLHEWRNDWRDIVQCTGASVISLNDDILTEPRAEQFVYTKLPILAYTVNNPVRAKELLHWGLSAVFSDNPEEIIKAL